MADKPSLSSERRCTCACCEGRGICAAGIQQQGSSCVLMDAVSDGHSAVCASILLVDWNRGNSRGHMISPFHYNDWNATLQQ